MKLSDRRIVLTGAASGIGRALLERLAAYPACIVAADVQPERLAQAARAISSPRAEITTFVCDLSRQESVDALFDCALQAMGGVDLFIANAGLAYYEKIASPDWERLAKIYQINVFSPLYATARMAQLNAGRPYKVVITASAMSHMAVPGYAIYSSTKAALHRFAEGYRYELQDPSTLTLVYPIATRTAFFEVAAGSRQPTHWPTQSPAHVARAIVRGIERDKAAIYPSRLFRLVLFLDRFVPLVRRVVTARDRRQLRRLRG
jgi:short-subunit dehydrogenase